MDAAGEAVVSLAVFFQPIIKTWLKEGKSWEQCIKDVEFAMEESAVKTTRVLPRGPRAAKLRVLRTKIHPRVVDLLSSCVDRVNPENN
jgi:hypothetical protein